MFEKVNPSHPDKIADRIAGAIVDLAYKKVNGKELCYDKHPKIAVEVLIGHGDCHIIAETSVHLDETEINFIVGRIAGLCNVDYKEVPQDKILAQNQEEKIHCGDNGIFKGVSISQEEKQLTQIVELIYDKYPYDGKYIICNDQITACQSNCKELPIETEAFNPLGYWTGGPNVDTGATNRKLGSDMGRAVTGGGLHGKDLTKADVSVNIYLHLIANAEDSVVRRENEVYGKCAIGDDKVKLFYPTTGGCLDFYEIVKTASNYIKNIGGFEKLAEWGLIR